MSPTGALDLGLGGDPAAGTVPTLRATRAVIRTATQTLARRIAFRRCRDGYPRCCRGTIDRADLLLDSERPEVACAGEMSEPAGEPLQVAMSGDKKISKTRESPVIRWRKARMRGGCNEASATASPRALCWKV